MGDAADRTRAYVADVAHDLQNPLVGMRAQLEVALTRSRTSEQETWLRSMLAATTEMELLVSDLLALEAKERPDLPPPVDLVDLDSVVEFEAARPRPPTNITIDVSGVQNLKVRGDEISLRRLVRNLLDNAVRHASSRVSLSLRNGQEAVVFEVVDDGPGVPPEHRERIFDRFYRADPKNREGTGLGLAIVRQVAERHGGTVAMLPAGEGEGAHFRVELPIPD